MASATGIFSTWRMGDCSIYGPIIGLGSQCIWASVIVTGHLWGFVPLTVAMTIVHARNLIKWRQS